LSIECIDLSMEVEPGVNPNYPDHPWYELRPIVTHATGAFESNGVAMFLHAGSHVDAPYHFDQTGAKVDEVPLENLVGYAMVLDVSDAEPGERIDGDRLARAKEQALAAGARYEAGMIALVRTDWSERAAPPAEAWWQDGPFLDRSAAQWLVDEKFASVGFDFPQDKLGGDMERLKALKSGDTRLEDMEDPPLPVHVVLLTNGICQIENIARLKDVPVTGAIVCAAPLLLDGAEAAPARVVAIVER